MALAETARDVEFPGGSLGFLVYFVALWVGVTALLGVLSGWPTLAKQFRAADYRDTGSGAPDGGRRAAAGAYLSAAVHEAEFSDPHADAGNG